MSTSATQGRLSAIATTDIANTKVRQTHLQRTAGTTLVRAIGLAQHLRKWFPIPQPRLPSLLLANVITYIGNSNHWNELRGRTPERTGRFRATTYRATTGIVLMMNNTCVVVVEGGTLPFTPTCAHSPHGRGSGLQHLRTWPTRIIGELRY